MIHISNFKYDKLSLLCYLCIVMWEQRLGIDHFTVVGLATWPLNGSEAGGDLVLTHRPQCFYCANQVVFYAN